MSGRAATVPLVYERDGERFATRLEVIPGSTIRPLVVTPFILAVSALFLLLWARPTASVRAFYYMATIGALSNTTQNPAAGYYLPWSLALRGE